MPRTWVVLTNDDSQTVVEMADESGRTPRQELNYLIAQAVRRWRSSRRRRAALLGEADEEGHAA